MSDAPRIDASRNIVHAINYSVFMQLIKYSDSRLHKHRSLWDKLIFLNNLAVKQLSELASTLEFGESQVAETFDSVIQSLRLTPTKDILILTIKDPYYPRNLLALDRPPPVLFLRGNPELLEDRCVAVVGTREPTDIGIKRAQRVAMELTENQFTVVSGLARGIDTAAHTAAIKTGGQTIAIIGSAIDQSYPSENYALQEAIGNGHLLLSQFVFGQQIRPWNFPLRNNTMVGLSEATIIVEAKVEGGGAKIQGELCLKAGRKLFIMKSFVSDKVPWTHEFIERGAIVFDKVETLLEQLGKKTERTPQQESTKYDFAYSARSES